LGRRAIAISRLRRKAIAASIDTNTKSGAAMIRAAQIHSLLNRKVLGVAFSRPG